MRITLAAMVALGCAAAHATPSGVDRAAYRADLVAVMRAVGDMHGRTGSSAPAQRHQIEQSVRLMNELTDHQVDVLADSLPPARLHALAGEIDRLLVQAAAATAKTVIVANPDVTPAFCNDYPGQVVLAALIAKHVAQNVLSTLEFTCQESVLGVNAALGCEGPEIASTVNEVASELANFCGNQQSAAGNEGILATERSAGQHLNIQLDAALSTRATQVALDQSQASATSSDDVATATRSDLDLAFVQIDARLDDALDELTDLAGDISAIQARTDDIAFRVRINQANVEDIQDSSADLQAMAHELVGSLEGSRQAAAAIAEAASALQPGIESSAQQTRRDDLAAALGDENAQVASFALPVAVGGRLEQAREVLIAAIQAFQTLGQGNVTQAQALLTAGDQAYNTGRYADAWRQFSSAYRALDPHVAGANRGAP